MQRFTGIVHQVRVPLLLAGCAAVLTAVILLAVTLGAPKTAQAVSNFQTQFVSQYPRMQNTRLDNCRLCHSMEPELNAYGQDYALHGHNIRAVELLDSDGDGFTNLAEINAGTFPGDKQDHPAGAPPEPAPKPTAQLAVNTSAVYKIIGWNDLGMHCMSPNYSNMSILPPFNTVWAQVILQGDPPQIVTQGITVEYSIENNTYSVGKTNFWTYAPKLFGINLAPNYGLKGATLSGTMKPAGDHFIVEGIPATSYLDGKTPIPANWYPYNIGHLIARDTATGQVLAETRPVVPVSEEMHCETCHADGMQEGIATGNVETNILTLHDQESGTHLMQNRPVLCAACHADNALGMAGNPNLPNLSRAMHDTHKLDAGNLEQAKAELGKQPEKVTEGTNNCYLCHPGTTTKCLRDVMYAKGLTCIDCHGRTADVANPSRRPWIDVPKCSTCHAAQYAENPNTRYRDSVGHGGLYCEACHGSPHAILPSTQANDNIQNIALQGYAGTLQDCTVCHGKIPAGPGPHSIVAKPTPTPSPTPPTCAGKPPKPVLVSPLSGAHVTTRRIPLDWQDTRCAKTFVVTVREGSKTGTVVQTITTPGTSQAQTKRLTRGKTYFWRVQACNKNNICNGSGWWSVKID